MATQPKGPKSTSTKPIVDKLKAQQTLKRPTLRPAAPKVSARQLAVVAKSPLSPAQKARLASMRAQYRAYFGS